MGGSRQVLRRVQETNGLQDYDVLTLRREGQGYAFVLGLRDTPIVGLEYEPPPEVRGVIDRVFESGQPRATEVYTDSFGTFVSAFAPVRDHRGVVVGLLEIDNDVSLLLHRLRERMTRAGLIGAAALVAAIALMFLLARGLTSSISRLAFAMREVEAGRYETRVEVRSEDEIGVLARVFDSMLRGLREQLALLRFVPRHTRALIAGQLQAHPETKTTFLAEKRDLVVLFSDIRGFTSMSDELPPDRIIAMLNIYLRMESDIHRASPDGSVDKFIGDAVMAIFEGPDALRGCRRRGARNPGKFRSRKRRRSLRAPSRGGYRDREGGDMIMGGVGSEERMELAVIGRLVNLPSRLTSVAGRGEIVVAERAFDILAPNFLRRTPREREAEGVFLNRRGAIGSSVGQASPRRAGEGCKELARPGLR